MTISRHKNGERVDLTQYDEPKLKEIARWVLEPDFTVEDEVTGVYLVDGSTRVRTDFLLTPKPHLVKNGFVDATVALEVKSPQSSSVSGYDLAWQTVTYANSAFRDVRPAFALIFPAFKWFWPDKPLIQNAVKSLLQYANVGELQLGYRVSDARNWRMVFGPAPYYERVKGLGSQPNGALKRRIGNAK
jgi:hypothetical protein